MKEDLLKWIKQFYSGSDKVGKVELKAFNEKYCLCYLKGSAGYVSRVSGNSYSASEWYVFENFSELDSMWRLPRSLFHCEGRLTKEHKENIIVNFDLEVPKQKRVKSKRYEDSYLIAIDNDAFWCGGFNSKIYCQKIVKEEENKFTTFSNSENKNVTFNKGKYRYIVANIDEMDEVLKEVSEGIKEYKQLSSELYSKKQEILKIFQNKL
jgi:hypothetical protein